MKENRKTIQLPRFSFSYGGCPSGVSMRIWFLREINLSAQNKRTSRLCASWRRLPLQWCVWRHLGHFHLLTRRHGSRGSLLIESPVVVIAYKRRFPPIPLVASPIIERKLHRVPYGHALVVRTQKCVVMFPFVDLAVGTSANTQDGFSMYRILRYRCTTAGSMRMLLKHKRGVVPSRCYE